MRFNHATHHTILVERNNPCPENHGGARPTRDCQKCQGSGRVKWAERWIVLVEVSTAALAAQLGQQAVRGKTGQSREASGAVLVTRKMQVKDE